MLCAGDEFGRTQGGNNNAYAQDNGTTWLDWEARDTALEDFVAALSAMRTRGAFADPAWLDGARWDALDGGAMTPEGWDHAAGFVLTLPHARGSTRSRVVREARLVTLEEVGGGA
jgi:glycogen operon protein